MRAAYVFDSLGNGDARLAEVPAVFPNAPALRLDGPLADSIFGYLLV